MRNRLCRSLSIFLLVAGAAPTLGDDAAQQSSPGELNPEAYEQVQTHLRSLEVLGPQGPFFRDPAKRQAVADRIGALDARQIEKDGILTLTLVALDAEDMRTICQLRRMKALGLHHCTITADAFAVLAEEWSPTLQRLQLSYVTVEGDGFADSLGKLDKLEWLTVNATRGIGIDALHSVNRFDIRALDMNRLPRGMDGAEVIQQLQTEFKALERLDLHHWQKFRAERAALEEQRPGIYGKLRGKYGFETGLVTE